MTTRAFVLLSGGIDSSTCLFLAGREYAFVTGISVFYGQRHVRELDAAKVVCQLQSAEHHVLDLSAVIPKTMLTDTSREIPSLSYEEIEGCVADLCAVPQWPVVVGGSQLDHG
jgi:7-cyano-7-deazaguanine synthase